MLVKMLSASFCDVKTGEFSTSKLWLNIGYIAMTAVFLRQTELSWELLLAYGAIVTGNHTAIFWLTRKYQNDHSNSVVH